MKRYAASAAAILLALAMAGCGKTDISSTADLPGDSSSVSDSSSVFEKPESNADSDSSAAETKAAENSGDTKDEDSLSPEQQQSMIKQELSIADYDPNEDEASQAVPVNVGEPKQTTPATQKTVTSYVVVTDAKGAAVTDAQGATVTTAVETPAQTGNGTAQAAPVLEGKQWIWLDIRDYKIDCDFIDVQFKVKDNAAEGYYCVNVADSSQFANADAVMVPFSHVDGGVLVGNATHDAGTASGFRIETSLEKANPGDTVTVRFLVKDNPGVCATLFKMAYDSNGLEFVSAAPGEDSFVTLGFGDSTGDED